MEDLKKKIVSKGYYPCKCNECGFLASSEFFDYQSYGDDGEVYCPCGASEKHLEMDNDDLWREINNSLYAELLTLQDRNNELEKKVEDLNSLLFDIHNVAQQALTQLKAKEA